MNQLIIVGGGVSGYAGAIYAARAELKPILFTGDQAGGQLMLTTVVENFPGFPEGIEGPELVTRMRQQAEKFGTEIIAENVNEVDLTQGHLRVNGRTASAIILATGAESIQLGVEGEADYIGRGVSYCAVCDAAFFRGKKVVVVGGGDAAMEDAMALTKYATEITLIHRRDSFRASKIMQDRVLKHDKITVRWNSEVVKVGGDKNKVTEIMIRDRVEGKEKMMAVDGVFVAIGHRPATDFLKGQIELDEKGYVKVGFGRIPTMTSVEGVFAGGDNVDHRYKQAITAAGMGVQAALDAQWWLEARL